MYRQEYRWSTPPIGADISWIKYLGGEAYWKYKLPPDFKVGTITWILTSKLSDTENIYHPEKNRFQGNFSGANFEVLSTNNFHWGDLNVTFIPNDSSTESSTSPSIPPPDSTSISTPTFSPTLIQGLKHCINLKTKVYCKNEEESTLYRTVMSSMGYTWRSGTSYMSKDFYFDTQFEGIIYNPEKGTYISHLNDCSRDFFVLFEDLSIAGIHASRYIVRDRLNKYGFIGSTSTVKEVPIPDTASVPYPTYIEKKPSYTPDLIMQPININLTTKTKNKWTIK